MLTSIFNYIGAAVCVLIAIALILLCAALLLDWYQSLCLRKEDIRSVMKKVEFYDTYRDDMWCVHVEGPDDIVASPTQQAANDYADQLRTFHTFNGHDNPNYPDINPVVKPWPYTPEAHLENVRQQARDLESLRGSAKRT